MMVGMGYLHGWNLPMDRGRTYQGKRTLQEIHESGADENPLVEDG
jgi:hypothetical protein